MSASDWGGFDFPDSLSPNHTHCHVSIWQMQFQSSTKVPLVFLIPLSLLSLRPLGFCVLRSIVCRLWVLHTGTFRMCRSHRIFSL